MNPPGKTTFSRMQRAAQIEAERIEISQDARVSAGMLDAPMPEQVALRDDFAGIVRLFDAIEREPDLKERIAARLASMKAAEMQVAAQAEALAKAAAAREVSAGDGDAVAWDAE
jgi:hypothetical protein